jgi:hypothetical protein
LASHRCIRQATFEFVFLCTIGTSIGEDAKDIEADVVPRVFVSLSRVPQAHD